MNTNNNNQTKKRKLSPNCNLIKEEIKELLNIITYEIDILFEKNEMLEKIKKLKNSQKYLKRISDNQYELLKPILKEILVEYKGILINLNTENNKNKHYSLLISYIDNFYDGFNDIRDNFIIKFYNFMSYLMKLTIILSLNLPLKYNN